MTDTPATSCGPDACTLPLAERPLRQAEFDDVLAAALSVTRSDAQHLQIVLGGADEVAARVSDLAAREVQCCSFFTFGVHVLPAQRVAFDIAVPPAHVAVLDELLARAAARAGR